VSSLVLSASAISLQLELTQPRIGARLIFALCLGNRMELSYFADIVTIISGFMTIIGISGVVTWSLTRNSKTLLEERIVAVFVISVKCFICILLAVPLYLISYFILGFIIVFLRDIFDEYNSAYSWWWSKDHPAAYTVAYIVAFLPSVPIWLLTCKSIIDWSFEPFKYFYVKFTNSSKEKE